MLIVCSMYPELSFSADVLRDPTRPMPESQSAMPVRVDAPHPGWTLESTLVAANRRVAVINGQLVSEGDSVDGAQVLEIREFFVLVKTSSRRVALQLLPNIVEKNP